MREEEIRKLLFEEIKELQLKSQEKVRNEYEKNKGIYISSYLEAVDSLLKKVKKLQDKEKLGSIEYIWINCIRASVETGSYKYAIKAYDEEIYYDTDEGDIRYVSEYKKNYIEEDKKYLEKLVLEKVIRAKKYEIRDLQKWYIWNTYIKQMPKEMEDAIERIKELESYKEIKKHEEVIMRYGEMLEYPEREYKLYKNDLSLQESETKIK